MVVEHFALALSKNGLKLTRCDNMGLFDYGIVWLE
jgi:hypothetical protein